MARWWRIPVRGRQRRAGRGAGDRARPASTAHHEQVLAATNLNTLPGWRGGFGTGPGGEPVCPCELGGRRRICRLRRPATLKEGCSASVRPDLSPHPRPVAPGCSQPLPARAQPRSPPPSSHDASVGDFQGPRRGFTPPGSPWWGTAPRGRAAAPVRGALPDPQGRGFAGAAQPAVHPGQRRRGLRFAADFPRLGGAGARGDAGVCGRRRAHG